MLTVQFLNRGAKTLCLVSVAWAQVAWAQSVGPDLIAGGVAQGSDIAEYGTYGDIAAYAFRADSCNRGDEVVLWHASDNRHPVAAQTMFRLKDGRFEQIGQAWVKHEYCALSSDMCAFGCQGGTGCEALGIGCSNASASALHGQQSNLGPKSEVNPTTGDFPYPFCAGGWCPPAMSSIINRRLQVHVSDLEPGNPNVLYFFELQYVAPDDAAWGNAANNASWQQVVVNSVTNLSVTGPTMREEPAIRAWEAFDPSVVTRKLTVQDEGGTGVHGFYWLASKATDLGGGWWHYEYALQNLNSDRSGRAFDVPVANGAQVTNVGFHDVDYHSGEPYDGTDWAATVGSTSVAWATDTYAQNPSANALRWGTLYNFRFDANVPPISDGVVELELFKPGSPSTLATRTITPDLTPVCDCQGDLDGDFVVSGDDIGPFVEMVLGSLPVDACAELASPHNQPLDMDDVAQFTALLLASPACS